MFAGSSDNYKVQVCQWRSSPGLQQIHACSADIDDLIASLLSPTTSTESMGMTELAFLMSLSNHFLSAADKLLFQQIP